MRNRLIYFLKVNIGAPMPNGGVCNYDADRIMEKAGLVPVVFPYNGWWGFQKLKQLIYLIKCFITIQRGAYFIFQFPLYHRLGGWLIRALAKYKQVQPVCFVIDVDGVRDGSTDLLNKEISELKQFSYFIAPNDRMKKWLLNLVPDAKITTIDFFDFLTEPAPAQRTKNASVVFAGNLSKSSFINQLDQLQNCSNTHFYIYGQKGSVTIPENNRIHYKGIIDPYQLPRQLTASFGLVWDGDCIDSCCGPNGEYLKYYSPHKLSSYIIGAMPVIAPENSASGDLVKKYKIGFCISSLHEIEKTITGLSNQDYEQMVANTKMLAGKISTGYCLQTAINDLLSKKH